MLTDQSSMSYSVFAVRMRCVYYGDDLSTQCELPRMNWCHRDGVGDVSLWRGYSMTTQRECRGATATSETRRLKRAYVNRLQLAGHGSCPAGIWKNWISTYDAAPPHGREVFNIFFHISSHSYDKLCTLISPFILHSEQDSLLFINLLLLSLSNSEEP